MTQLGPSSTTAPLARFAPRVGTAVRVTIAMLLVALQYVLSREVAVFDVRPEVLLLVACVFGVTGGVRRGAVVGFWAGLGADLFLTVPFGTSAFAYVVAGAIAGALGRDARPSMGVQAILVFVASAVGVVVFAVITALFGSAVGSSIHVVWVAIVVAALNAVVAPVAAKLIDPSRPWRSRRVVAGGRRALADVRSSW